MPSPVPRAWPEDLLIRYIVGSLPAEEARRLDELSVSDGEFAARLRAVENHLIDAYVHGQLPGDTLRDFEAHYLATPGARERVGYARALAARPAAAIGAAPWRRGTLPWLAAAALLVAGALVLYSLRPHEGPAIQGGASPPSQAPAQTAAPQVPPPALAAPTESAAATRSSAPMLSFFLAPPTRGVADVPRIEIPPGTASIELRLGLEADDFPAYRAALKDRTGARTLWRSENLRATNERGGRAVRVMLPAAVLKSGRYLVELAGAPRADAARILGVYTLRVVVQ